MAMSVRHQDLSKVLLTLLLLHGPCLYYLLYSPEVSIKLSITHAECFTINKKLQICRVIQHLFGCLHFFLTETHGVFLYSAAMWL